MSLAIKLSKRTFLFYLLAVPFSFILGYWMFIFSFQLDNFRTLLLRILSGTIILSGLFFLWLAINKLRDKRPGLVLTATGFINNSFNRITSEVLWNDVIGITIFPQKVELFYFIKYNADLFLIVVKNPEAYIVKETSIMKRMNLSFLFKKYHTPIIIATQGLRFSNNELKNLLEYHWQKAIENNSQ